MRVQDFRQSEQPCSGAQPGATFGAAGLFENKARMADIVAAENSTIIAFYDMRELWTTDREKAKELSNEAMEDIFRVLYWLEDRCDALEKRLAQRTAWDAVTDVGKKPAKKGGRKPAKKAAKKPAKKPAKRR